MLRAQAAVRGGAAGGGHRVHQGEGTRRYGCCCRSSTWIDTFIHVHTYIRTPMCLACLIHATPNFKYKHVTRSTPLHTHTITTTTTPSYPYTSIHLHQSTHPGTKPRPSVVNLAMEYAVAIFRSVRPSVSPRPSQSTPPPSLPPLVILSFKFISGACQSVCPSACAPPK